MKLLALNHVALHVADVERSAAFYREVLHLEPIPRPAFNFPGAWFRLGSEQELHLIGGRELSTQSHNRGNHWALQIDDMDAWERDFQARGIGYLPRRVRPDGALQIYLVDIRMGITLNSASCDATMGLVPVGRSLDSYMRRATNIRYACELRSHVKKEGESLRAR